MVTKQIIQEKLDNLTEEQLNEVYEIIKQFLQIFSQSVANQKTQSIIKTLSLS